MFDLHTLNFRRWLKAGNAVFAAMLRKLPMLGFFEKQGQRHKLRPT
jgi:hypothetical protein